MKVKSLFWAVMSCAIIGTTTSASAVELDRTYNREGIIVNLFGSISPEFTKSSSKFTYYGECTPTFCPAADRISSSGRMRLGTLEYLLEKQSELRGDKRPRLGNANNGFVGFQVKQKLRHDLTASGMLGLGAGVGGGATVIGNISLDHNDSGELTLGIDGSLPSGGVGTSGTYSVLDRSGSYVSFRYKQIPNVRLTGFYVFPDLPSTNNRDRAIENGYGATASYEHSFATRNKLTLRAGYTNTDRDDDLKNNRTARDKQAFMLGGRYNYYNTTLSLDGGVAKSDYHGNIIDSTKATSLGARLEYEINPRVTVYGSYGVRKTKATEATGVTLDFATLYNNTAWVGTRPINESQLFKTIDEAKYGIGADYMIHKNAILNASMERENTTYSLTTGKFSKLSENNYSIGATLFW